MRRHEALLQSITERSRNVLWLLPAWKDAAKLLSDCMAAPEHIEEATFRLSFALRDDTPARQPSSWTLSRTSRR